MLRVKYNYSVNLLDPKDKYSLRITYLSFILFSFIIGFCFFFTYKSMEMFTILIFPFFINKKRSHLIGKVFITFLVILSLLMSSMLIFTYTSVMVLILYLCLVCIVLYYIHETMLIEQGFIEKPFQCVITMNLDFIKEGFIKEDKNPTEYQFDHEEALHRYQYYIQILIKYYTVIYLFKRQQSKYGYWSNLIMYVMYFIGWSYILWISAPDLLLSLGIYILLYLTNIEEPFSGLVI